jgi:hypothetical protein
VPFVEQDDLVLAQLASEADCLRSPPRDAHDLVTGLLDRRGAVDPEHAARPLLPREPAIIPACVEPVTEQTTIVSKNTPSSRSCSSSS